MESPLTENLFSYGSLQNESIQLKIYGRVLEGSPDMLAGYRHETIKIKDEDSIATSRTANHLIIKYR